MDGNTDIHRNAKKSDKISLIAESESSNDIYGVIGVCGVVGNLVARVLMDQGLKVTGTDIQSEKECHFKYTLHDYNLLLYFGGHPESFFNESDYIIPPPSLNRSSDLFKRIDKNAKSGTIKVLDVEDVIKIITPDKPVLCITGTNGKTTTTSLLKHICSHSGLTPTEHGFKDLQGNIDYIPPLQCRLKGDVAVLETGTFGHPGDLEFILKRCQPSCGIITNITPDHMHKDQDFLNYARIKGEFVEYLHDKMLIVNADDPTVWGLIKSSYSQKDNVNLQEKVTEEVEVSGDIITFGVDYKTSTRSSKICWCGRDISLEETISGMGYYQCPCGLERPQPQYLATEIKKDSFTLHTPEEAVQVNMPIIGLHNIYNTLGAIAAAKEFLKIPLKQIISGIESFKGVPGRLDFIGQVKGKDIIIDYAHNPGGVETILQELKKIHGNIAVVITVASESGEKGDIDILKRSLKIADFIIPASFYSRKAADKFMKADPHQSGKIMLTSTYPQEFRNRTLGANSKQVINGLRKALKCDTAAVVCIGEAAFKYKENIHRIIDV